MFCPSCGGSEFERIDAEPTSKSNASASEALSGKICPRCKTRNETYALLCVCGESLEREPAIAHQAGQASSQPRENLHFRKATPKLWLIVGTQTLECRHGDVFGREGTLACDLFQPIPTVSGRHIAVEFRNNSWYLINLPLQPDRTNKNITEVDGRPLKLGESVILSGEHIVRISTHCEVRFRVEAM
jgi:hypothetical protein